MSAKLNRLSKGTTGKLLLEVLEEVKQTVADIRTPMTVKGDQNEIRLGIIEAIDSFLVEPLRVNRQELEPQDNDEFL